MIHIYCDESHDDTTYVLAGWIARPETWDRIADRWAEMLVRHKAPYFHAAEIMGRDTISDSPFKGWTREQEIAIFSEATDIILAQDPLPCAIGNSLPMFPVSLFIEDKDTAWFWLFVKFIQLLVLVPDDVGGVDFMFDDKPEIRKIVNAHYYEAKELINSKFPGRLRGADTVAFGDDAKILPLQAADFIAYEWRKSLSNRQNNPEKPERTSYTRLKACPRILLKYSREAMLGIMREHAGNAHELRDALVNFSGEKDA